MELGDTLYSTILVSSVFKPLEKKRSTADEDKFWNFRPIYYPPTCRRNLSNEDTQVHYWTPLEKK